MLGIINWQQVEVALFVWYMPQTSLTKKLQRSEETQIIWSNSAMLDHGRGLVRLHCSLQYKPDAQDFPHRPNSLVSSRLLINFKEAKRFSL